MPRLASPDTLHPVRLPDGTVHTGTVYLRPAIDHPNWDIGAYTNASAHEPPDDWAARLAPWLHPGAPESVRIGRFCQIADGAAFVTSSANHRFDGATSFPFAIVSGFGAARPSMPGSSAARDTIVGHDVWLGAGATVLPGARIGSGAIVGAGAVVAGEVPPYAIVAGNRAEVVRMRFAPERIERLLALAWWHWPPDRILAEEAALCGDDDVRLSALLAAV